MKRYGFVFGLLSIVFGGFFCSAADTVLPFAPGMPAIAVVETGDKIPADAVLLISGQFLDFGTIPAKGLYLGETTLRQGFEIQLGENVTEKFIWQVASYDPHRCLIEIEHDTKGIWPFFDEYARIRINPLVRGNIKTVFSCGAKEVTLHIRSL